MAICTMIVFCHNYKENASKIDKFDKHVTIHMTRHINELEIRVFYESRGLDFEENCVKVKFGPVFVTNDFIIERRGQT